jgi:CubicO group peptidase (beta-lactamase class C family)
VNTKILALACLALLSACGGSGPASEQASATPAPVAAASWSTAALQGEADRLRTSANLPGLALVVVENGIVKTVASGNRSVAGAVALSTDDSFQMGSQTKAATGMLMARLVEQRKLRWDSTLAELLPALKPSMHPDLHSVTVAQLLRNRSGIRFDLTEDDAVQLRPFATGELAVDRMTTARYVLQAAPAFAPDTGYLYSNLGYMLLGVIAEQAGGAPYEQLMAREVFGALRIEAGLGFPEDGGGSFASGHVQIEGAWQPISITGEERYAMDLVLPAGGMMLSAKEYGRFLRAHLDGLQGRSTYLSADTFTLIHTPVAGYGFGWLVGDDAKLGRISAHGGSWGTYTVLSIVVPGADRAVAVLCNCYSPQTIDQLDTLAQHLARGVRP